MTRATTAQVADQLLRTDEVAAWLSVSKSTLVRWRQSGEGPAVYWLAEGVPRSRVCRGGGVLMPVRRGDKWEGRLKIAGKVVRTRRFTTKRGAAEWERRQRSTFDEHGYDPSAGKVSVESLLPVWLEQREGRVSQTTLDTDRYLLPTEGQLSGRSSREPVLPLWFRKLHVVKVNGTAVAKWQDDLGKRDLAPTTVSRYRNSLSSFFSWCVSEDYLAHNPVASTKPPKDRRAREDMRPLPAPEFDQVVSDITELSPVYGDLVLVLGRTGLRWGEARSSTAPRSSGRRTGRPAAEAAPVTICNTPRPVNGSSRVCR